MFPRYLFIHLSEQQDDWRPIRSTIGVSNLVRFGQTPARVPDYVISNLRVQEDETGVCIVPERGFKEGDKVRVVDGVFEGYEAIFQSNSAKDRVSLLLTVIQKSIYIELNGRGIEGID